MLETQKLSMFVFFKGKSDIQVTVMVHDHATSPSISSYLDYCLAATLWNYTVQKKNCFHMTVIT